MYSESNSGLHINQSRTSDKQGFRLVLGTRITPEDIALFLDCRIMLPAS